MLSFKKLDVYRLSIEFLELAFNLVAQLPKGQAKLADQFRRAAMSIPLNIAEGAGKASPAEAAHHFAISRGSSMECGAILDIFRFAAYSPMSSLEKGDQLLIRLVSMLSKMCR